LWDFPLKNKFSQWGKPATLRGNKMKSMKTFVSWCEDSDLDIDLPEVTQEDVEEAKKFGKDKFIEQRARTGWSGNYPPAYFYAQYPHKYMNPRKATADLDAEHLKKD